MKINKIMPPLLKKVADYNDPEVVRAMDLTPISGRSNPIRAPKSLSTAKKF